MRGSLGLHGILALGYTDSILDCANPLGKTGGQPRGWRHCAQCQCQRQRVAKAAPVG